MICVVGLDFIWGCVSDEHDVIGLFVCCSWLSGRLVARCVRLFADRCRFSDYCQRLVVTDRDGGACCRCDSGGVFPLVYIDSVIIGEVVFLAVAVFPLSFLFAVSVEVLIDVGYIMFFGDVGHCLTDDVAVFVADEWVGGWAC